MLINNHEVCGPDFNVKIWLVTIDSIYVSDLLLALYQMRYLKTNRKESILLIGLRYIVLMVLVGFLISGNIQFFKSTDQSSDCTSARNFTFILLILGYFEMMKCCCVGTLFCIFVPLFLYYARQAEQPQWIPAPPRFVQNLNIIKFKPKPTEVENEEISCAICLLEYTELDEIIPLPCDDRHFFHAQCISDWLQNNNNCPLCKKAITDEALEEQKTRIQNN